MPPRIPGVQRLGTFSLCLRPAVKPCAPSLLPITQTASLSQKEKKRLAKQDPYRWAQMQQRKAAHEKRKEEIDAVREAQLGDPIRGLPTPFIESLSSAGQEPLSNPPVDEDGNLLAEPHELPTSPHVLNNLIHKTELESAIENAYILTQPLASDHAPVGSEEYQRKAKLHEEQHAKAVEALERITHIDNGSAKDRLHANIRRCVETFGRHETDLTLKPKALSRGQEREERPVRGGPDTGSSEVQIAILTAKIQALANELERGRGYKDKVGKRDLRLMLHRRQKLLQYMDRKERGSDRWQHMIETLGLSPATWKKQITT
ncbi:ribosomal protein S15 precursor-like protein [Hypoxylon rubiginosum]|uniref:Ribosomal protein S15-like protein n=1 Tax=Hypoxylon rubiginosum TaxID=110542 RepID=A0ACC0DK00_9PEZI|nr:ribosomal protein S15 precursor-like protein [Hypoxylon rubiginosum]